MNTGLVEAARSGDQTAFGALVDPYRRELQLHCYRILGSVADAEDALQETLLAAWQGLAGFEGRASIRTWLYRIATTRSLNLLRSATRRSPPSLTLDVEVPEPTRLGEVFWLEPYPDVLLEELPDTASGPEARYEAREAISLAFVTALQLLPPRQRAILVLRDVLAFSAREVAGMLGVSEQSVTSALKRARATLQRELPPPDRRPAPAPGSAAEQEFLDRLVRAYEDGDVDGLVAMMTEDAWLRMPPVPLEYRGRELVDRFFTTIAFRHGRRYHLIPTRANGQPAFGVYLRDPVTGIAHASGLLVITLTGHQASVITRFDNAVLPRFGLPRTLSD